VLAALAVRFVPVLPFTVLNYACGVTAMRLRHYAIGTAVGMVPGSTLWVAVGSVGGEISPWLPALVSVGLATLTLGVGTVVHRRRSGTPGDQPSPSVPVDQSSPSVSSVQLTDHIK
jgi:uncharacterized membrane protein YdjX (TVP38/TMEM64 family)